MPNCSIITCNNRSETKSFKKDGVTYHIYPKDPNIKEKWIDATGRGPNWFPVRRNVICSDHFQGKCFQLLNKSRRLFEWAIPTLKICQIVSALPDVTCETCKQKIIPRTQNQDMSNQAEILENDSTSTKESLEIPAEIKTEVLEESDQLGNCV